MLWLLNDWFHFNSYLIANSQTEIQCEKSDMVFLSIPVKITVFLFSKKLKGI